MSGWRVTSIYRFCLILLALTSLAATPAAAEEGQSAHIKARLVAETTAVAPGGDVMLAFDYTPTPGWHTYWVNPGDTGLAPTFDWNLPDGVTVDDIQWPTPSLLPAADLMSYGYEGHVTLVMQVHNASKLSAGDILPLKAHVRFLVCADVCVPEEMDVNLNLPVGEAKPGSDSSTIRKGMKTEPGISETFQTIDIQNGQVELGFSVTGQNLEGAYFFPLQSGVLAPSAPQILDVGPNGFTIRVKAAGATLPEGNLRGVLKFGDGKAVEYSLKRASLLPGVHGLGAPAAAKTDTSLAGILLAMGFAFVGGLILNLMPCVFPVLSMKLLSLAKSGESGGMARVESLIYAAGTIISFVALAAMLDVARRFGASLGWGFQLQSPYVTAALALVMLLVALNMSGLFEVGASLQGVGAGTFNRKRPLLSAFLTGVLAVVVAAPCTAPFMATAIGVALAQGGWTSFAIFVALGLGFALPFVSLTFLITLVPGVARALPRPGKWMDILKHARSVLMYLAALGLVWVFAQQVELAGLLVLVLALIVVVLAVLRKPLPRLAKPVVLLGGLVLIGLAASLPRTTKTEALPTGLLPHRDFSVAALAQLRAQDKPVFVDLTAAWCVTCKVNERLVLTGPAFEQALKETGTVYMVGDWTNQDAEISHYLSLYGRSGVPLYVYYPRHNAAPVVLPQLLNAGAVAKVMRDGAR